MSSFHVYRRTISILISHRSHKQALDTCEHTMLSPKTVCLAISWLVDLFHNREILIVKLYSVCRLFLPSSRDQFVTSRWAKTYRISMNRRWNESSHRRGDGQMCVWRIKSMSEMQSTQQTLCLRIGNPVAINADVWRQRLHTFLFAVFLSPSAEFFAMFLMCFDGGWEYTRKSATRTVFGLWAQNITFVIHRLVHRNAV